MKKVGEVGYNERLFQKGLRGKLHTARFDWLSKSVLGLNCSYKSVLELGCFDGKAIKYLPDLPDRYLGLDANWEGGLDIAKEDWADQSNYTFRRCTTPEEMEIGYEQFDISICMETLEHIPPQMVDPYLEKLAGATKDYIFITVPNEIGIVFLFKYLAKRLFGEAQKYSTAELINSVLGNTDKVERDQHKGFNYHHLVEQVSNYFEILEVSGLQSDILPTSLNFSIGIIGRSK